MVLRAGFHGTVGQPSAQVIDGSVGFTSESQTHLTRTPSSESNRKTFTYSCWVKRDSLGDNPVNNKRLFSARDTDAASNSYSSIYFRGTGLTGQLEFLDYLSGTREGRMRTEGRPCRDTSGWYHICVAVDYTDSTAKDRIKIYINGVRQGRDSAQDVDPDTTDQTFINSTEEHNIGKQPGDTDKTQSGRLSQVYLIDGQALGPENFGFTDPLTNTWRPKKFSGNYTVDDGYSKTWTNEITGTQFNSSNPKEHAFDGDLNTWTTATNGNSLTWTPSGGLAVSSSLRIYAAREGSNDNITVTFTDTTTFNSFTADNTFKWYTITGAGGKTIDNIVWTHNNTFSRIAAIEVDGTILTDFQGTNSFYLPMDGNSPIGQDKSGNGNDWTPVNFGGSNSVEKATGALPILNTTQGGTQAGVGVFGSRQNVGYAVTVYNDGGGNKYYIDGVKQDTVTGLIRGATYTFDQSDSTNSNHPLRFSITDNGTHTGGGVQYTDGNVQGGTPGSAGAATTITVPHDAPNTLYYYCANHSGMGGSITGITTNEKLADQYASNIVLALPLVGSKDDVSASIACTSTTKTTAVSGNAASNSASSNFYGNSFYFDGTSDYHDSTITALASRDFTIEFWFMSTATDGYQTLFEYGDHTSNGVFITLRDGDAIAARSYNGQDISNATLSSPSHNTPKDKWHHIAITRESNTAKLFINGKYIGNKTWSTSYTPTKVRLGHSIYSAGSGEDLTGYIQDVRIYDGVVKYTGTTVNEQSFVVPSTNPDILPDTPSGVSGGSKLTKITDGAVSFDGSNDYLTLSSGADFAFGTGDFTVECYVYSNNRGTHDYIIDGRTSGQTSGTWSLSYGYGGGNGRLEFASGSSTLLECPANFNPESKKWTHIAITRSGTDLRMFIDGVVVTSATNSTNFSTAPGTSYIGTRYSQEHFWDGFISNVRVIKGTALYTSNFTPPSAPLTNVTNTKLLCCQSNTSATAAAVAPNLDTYTVKDINGGTYWSGATLSDGSNLAGLFDVSLSTNAQQSTNGTAASITNFGPVNVSSTVSFYSPDGDARYTLNGGAEVSVSGTGWHDISFSGTLTSFTFQAPGNARIFIYGMKIDGTQLVDIITANGNAAATNFNPFNTDINTVRGQETGYCTLNPLAKGDQATIGNGNLEVTAATSGSGKEYYSTLSMSSGKWYAEFKLTGTACLAGISNDIVFTSYFGSVASGYGYYNNGNTYNGGSAVSYGDSVTTGDVLGIIFDADNGKLFFSKNGIIQNSGIPAYTGLTNGPYWFGGGENGATGLWNFGQKPFKFPPPDGFQSLNLANVRPETVIARPDQYVGVTTYTSNNNTLSVSDYKFQPDLLLFKNRDTANHWGWFDSVRGVNKQLSSSRTNAEITTSGDGYGSGTMNSFDPFGFTLGDDVGSNVTNYPSDDKHVAYGFKAGGNKNTFNVDDVGYANASDVNMNVGALNDASYNKTQNWSAGGGSGLYSGSTWGPVFDGTPAADGHNIAHSAYVTNNGSSTLTFSTAISGVLTIKTCQGSDNTSSGTSRPYVELSNGQTIRVDGGTSNPSTHSFGEVSNITSLTIRGTSAQGMNLIFVKLDGKLLVDSGATVNAPSIAPSGCSVGTKQGFSIIKYDGSGTAGDTIPHGLSQTPEFVVVKDTEDSDNWQIYHAGAQTSGAKLLKFTDTGVTSNNGPWNNTAPTSTLITLGGGGTNDSDNTHICYAWHSVPGLQKFGSWTGTNSADGNFVELGFRPALVIAKESSATGAGAQWFMLDSSRNTYNPLNNIVDINRPNAERQAVIYDFLSNGFKVRISFNSGATFIYMAWAEAPAFNLYGAQSNAR